VQTRLQRRTSNSTAPIISYCGDFGHRTLIGRVISLAKKWLSGKLLRRIPFDWGRVLCGSHNMRSTTLWWYIGWLCALHGRFSAVEHAKGGGGAGFARRCEIDGYGKYSLTGPACSAGGSGGRTRGQGGSELASRNPSDGGAFYVAGIWPDNAQPTRGARRVEPAIATRLASGVPQVGMGLCG
jgi:hypothetical protein